MAHRRLTGKLELTWTNKDQMLISEGDGRYDYSWVDPSDLRAREIRLLESIGTYSAPDGRPAGSDLPEPTTDNLLVTGDALHVLAALANAPELRDHYAGQVKLVYIDPPFNTGQTFTSYEDNLEHSIWLTMLRDRIRQVKPLLAPDASIWVHLDDAEVHRMRSVMDEVLGGTAFVATVIWQKADATRNDAKGFSASHDYLLVFRASPAWSPNRFERTLSDNARFTSPDGDPKPWWDDNLTAPGAKASDEAVIFGVQHPITGELIYPTTGRHWAAGQAWMMEQMRQWAPYELKVIDDVDRRAEVRSISGSRVRQGVPAIMLAVPLAQAAQEARSRYAKGNWPMVVLRSGGVGGLGRKARIPTQGIVPDTLWFNRSVGHNRQAKAELKALFPGVATFDTPKPERLLQRIIYIATKPGDLVLDFYAGSGTTAAVAQKMGRRWITCELSETNVSAYTLPRLLKVINGEDPGGVTSTVLLEAVRELPSGVTPDAAQKFQTTLRKVLDGGDPEDSLEDEVPEDVVPEPVTLDLDVALAEAVRAAARRGESPMGTDESKALLTSLRKLAGSGVGTFDLTGTIKSALIARTKTRHVKTRRWYGGGGFTHLKVGPSMFETIDQVVYLADWARGGDLARAVAAQLGYRFDDSEYPFSGHKGRKRLAVIDGSATPELVEHIVGCLEPGQTTALYATSLDPDARTKLPASCTLDKVPQAILDNYRRTVRRRRPVDWAKDGA